MDWKKRKTQLSAKVVKECQEKNKNSRSSDWTPSKLAKDYRMTKNQNKCEGFEQNLQ